MNLVQVLPKGRFGEMISFEFHLKNQHEKTQKPLWFLGFQPRYLFRCYLLVEVTGLEPTTSWSLTKRATKLRYTSISTHFIITKRQSFVKRKRGFCFPLFKIYAIITPWSKFCSYASGISAARPWRNSYTKICCKSKI